MGTCLFLSYLLLQRLLDCISDKKSYITQLEQAIYHAANNIDLIRQHLNSLKHDSHSYEGNLPSTLVSQIHRYEDHLTTSKMTYNKAVEDYNLAITVMPYHAIKKPQPLDYFSDFLI